MAIYYGDGSNSGAGRIVQMETAELRTSIQSTAQNLDVLAKAITPKSTSNYIIIFGMTGCMSNVQHCGVHLYRDSSRLTVGSDGQTVNYVSAASFDNNNYGSNGNASYGEVSLMHIDHPNTTSQVTYKIVFNQVGTGGYSLYVNRSPSQYMGSLTRLILMEIAV
jgi:hypothetical protein